MGAYDGRLCGSCVRKQHMRKQNGGKNGKQLCRGGVTHFGSFFEHGFCSWHIFFEAVAQEQSSAHRVERVGIAVEHIVIAVHSA